MRNGPSHKVSADWHWGCPRQCEIGFTMAEDAARYGRLELVKWLCGEGGFAMDEVVMSRAAGSGNLELVQFLRGEGYPWDFGRYLRSISCSW